MSEIPDDIKLARARASIFEAAVHKYFPQYVDVCTINDALDAYAAERQRQVEVMEEVRKVLEPFARYQTADGLADGFLRVPDQHPLLRLSIDNDEWITVGDFRAARALLSKLGEL